MPVYYNVEPNYRIQERNLSWGKEYFLEKKQEIEITPEQTVSFWVLVKFAPSQIELERYLEELQKAGPNADRIVKEDFVPQS